MYFPPNDPNPSVPSVSWDLGQPAPGVTAQGKPVLLWFEPVTGDGAQEYLFVRGSDNALWMNHQEVGWTSLGGIIYGDPSAVYWDGGTSLNVFALGTDDNIWTFGIYPTAGVNTGWSQVPTPSPYGAGQRVLFSGPPKAFSKSASTIDVFAVGEDGGLYTIPFSSPGGWSTPIDLGTMDQTSSLFSNTIGVPNHTPVSITSWGGNELDILATSETDVAHAGNAGGAAGTTVMVR
jgi:hypothetical protein